MKYAPLIIKKLADLLVGNNTVNKLSGKDLVDLFNEFGFNDDYIYPNVGIATADLGNGLSRTDYARKRLRILNDKEQVDDICFSGKNNGMKKLSKVFRGTEVYGEIEFKNIHRSKIAEIANNI